MIVYKHLKQPLENSAKSTNLKTSTKYSITRDVPNTLVVYLEISLWKYLYIYYTVV